MGINYFICLITVLAFHHILDTGNLYVNYTVPAMWYDDEIDSGVSNVNNMIGDGSDMTGEVEGGKYLRIADETKKNVKLRLNRIDFCNDTIYTCLITVQCRDATTEEKEYLLEKLQTLHDDDDDDDDDNIDEITMDNI